MAREKPNSSSGKRTTSSHRKYPADNFRVTKQNSVKAAGLQQTKFVKDASPSTSIQPSKAYPTRNGTKAVASDKEIDMLDYPQASNPCTPLITAVEGRTSNRKRALADDAEKTTRSSPRKEFKDDISTRGSATFSEKRRKVTKTGFEVLTHSPLSVLQAVKRPVRSEATRTDPDSTTNNVQKFPTRDAQRAKISLVVAKKRWSCTVGKSVKIKRRELLQVQVKPATRLLAQPRFVFTQRDDRHSESHVVAAITQEMKSLSKILEPGMPGLEDVRAFSENFDAYPNLDADIAKGLKAIAVDTDPKEVTDALGEPEDDDRKVETAQTTKCLNTLVVYNGLDRSLPPIHSLPEIFEDIVVNGLHDSKRHQLPAFLKYVQGRELRLGTMCSGTECPVLALSLINDALTRMEMPTIPFVHVLSCEIVPYKQAYIQRNFDPQYLFRDVTELAGQKASTAYGSAVEVPKDLDILIAGSSCKDYSGLNNQRKEYGEEGQSLSTFRGVLGYASRYKPRIVLLENVYKAPWKQFQMEFEGIGYETFVAKVDTKDFYIPQTRNRGYMIGFNWEFAQIAGYEINNIGNEWAHAFQAYSRRASSPFTDFIYSEEDPQLDQIKRELIISQSLEKPRRKVEWLRCRHRYLSFRAAHALGFRKPLTMWENNGSCKFPDGSWLKWAKGQVERIWDTLEISQMRCVSQRDYDSRWKIRVVELSQNIDRDNDPRAWGIIGCITPSGIPYLTTRGGPITGPELLALQGIPTDKLSLTYETSRQLQDFAGNAMTSTVVGAAMLAAFGVGFRILDPGPGASKKPSEKHETSFSKLVDDGTGKPRIETSLPVGRVNSGDMEKVKNLASSTMQLCSCEGRFGRTRTPLQRCLSCHHTTCTSCGQNPLHNYLLMPKFVTEQRRDPSDFEEKIRSLLPLQLRFKHIEIPTFFSQNGTLLDTREKVIDAIRDAFNHPVHLIGFSRTNHWTATYESSYGKLDIVFTREWAPESSSSNDLSGFLGAVSIQCYLYAKAEANEPVGSPVRADLEQPIARMTCGQSIFDDGWEIRLPEPAQFTLEISYLGQQVTSWEAKLGLQDKMFRDRQVTHRVMLKCPTESHAVCPEEIPGVYELLPDCDAASGSLHRKLENPGSSSSPIFFFLDPGQLCNAAQDSFVFAKTHHRLPLGGARDILARIEKGWRPASSPSDVLYCMIPGKWRKCQQTHLEVPTQDEVRVKTSVPSSIISMKIDISRCAHADFTALVCSFPLSGGQHKQWTVGNVYSIDLIDKPDALRPFVPLIQRAGQDCGFDHWVEIAFPSHELAVCKTCAPAKPRLIFPTVHSNALIKHVKEKSEKPLLVEDQYQAFDFEKKIKSRPPPVVADLHCHKDGNGILKLEVNVSTLVHRAHGKLIGHASKCAPLSGIRWRLAKDSGFEQILPFPKLYPSTNENDPPADHPPNWVKEAHLLLRTPQRKSLRWMLDRESESTAFWIEEEIEEARILSANLRLEAKVECTRRIRGGILADEVGYGKTAIILALFDSDASDRRGKRRLQTTALATRQGKIKIKATLVLAPANLLQQWHSEFDRFLQKKPVDNYVILRIESEKELKALTIKQVSEADLILSTWEVFGDWYLEELAYLGRSPQLPKHPGRAFQQWLKHAMQNLGVVVKGSEAREYQDYLPTWRMLDEEKPSSQDSDVASITSDKTADGKLREKAEQILDDNFKVVHMEEREDPKIAPLLHLFSFRRVVTDEFTYVQGKNLSLLLQLDAPRKWALSGTPPLGSFRELNNMAMLLGTKLSTDDNDGGVFESQSVLKDKMKDKTLAEEFQFYSYQTRHSPSWYNARHALCQKFVNQFIRKNPADLRGVELNHHYEVLELSAAERATYFELFQILMNQPVKFSAKEKTKAKDLVEKDRTQRLQEMACASRSPEEALLICCSTSMSSVNGVEAKDRNAGRVCKAILAEKEKHFGAEVDKLYEKLVEVFELWELGYEDNAADNPHFYSFIRSVDNNTFGDLVAKAILDRIMGYARAVASKTAANSKMIPPGVRSLAAHAKAAWSRLSKSDQKGLKAQSSKRTPAKKMKQDTPIEQTNADSSEHSSAVKKTFPDRRELAPRKTFMYWSAAVLTNLSLGLVEHLRGLRFFSIIEGFVNAGRRPQCSKCGKKPSHANDILILGLCGHVCCKPCFKENHAQRRLLDECIAEGCEATAPRHAAFPLSELDVATSHLPRPFGSKIDAVLKLLKDKDRVGTEDHVIIFVQFHRLKNALIEGLENAKISYLDGSNKHVVEKFKNGVATVCILDPESVNAAGWNLQVANHIIFLSSLVIDTQYNYESIHTQAIGRAYRRGQEKAVHVYHFLAARTLDVNILENREEKKLVQRDGKCLLLAEDEIEEDEKSDLAGAAFEGAACSMDN